MADFSNQVWRQLRLSHTQIYNSRQLAKFFILQSVSLGSKRRRHYWTSLGSSHVQLKEMWEVLTRV